MAAAAAYTMWGLFPLYFRWLKATSALEVLVHRVLWSLVFMVVVLGLRRQWAWIAPTLRSPRVLAAFAASAALLSANWLTYIWSVQNGHVVDASLGYFITPLVNVLLGTTVLRERPRAAQWVALALAAVGVLWLTWASGHIPWIALVLASSFGAYGLLRKVAALGALEGLALETLWLLGPALALLAWGLAQGTSSFAAGDFNTRALLIGVGPLTAVPLLLFAAGARRIRMTTLGLLQYIGPSIQLALGVALFHEPFGWDRALGFALIWSALAVYSAESWWIGRRA